VSEFVGQGNDSTCVAVAVVNACLHLGVPPPPLESLVSEMCCDNGGAIGADAVISRVLGMSACDEDSFFDAGGILTIMHPIFNLHACLCVADGCFKGTERWRYTLVNSWLGPLVCRNLGRREIEQFLPNEHNRKMWAFPSVAG